MQVLNTYVKSGSAGSSILLFVAMFAMLVVVYLLKDDITRFLESHTIGASFYSFMKHVWKVLMGVIFVVFLSIILFAPKNEQIFVEATIVDNYPIGALYEKYEIVEKRGEIWVLEQRSTWQEDVDSSDTVK